MAEEHELYPAVARWLKRHFRCFATGQDTGLKHSRIDVVGLRDVGGDLSGSVEVIAVEVKRGNQPFATASGQASGYKIYADRVYLADLRSSRFSSDEVTIASNLAIGLIRIHNGRCREILTSPTHQPPEKFRLLLLECLGYGRCQFCDCVFEVGAGSRRFSKVTRENVRLALRDGRGLMFWNHLVGSRKLRIRSSTSKRYDTFERRFLCPDCLDVMGRLAEEFQRDRTK